METSVGRPFLVTGAAGKTGLAVLRALDQAGAPTRALVRRPEQEPTVRAAGAGHVVVGDLLDAETVGRAVAGAGGIYHICPNMHPEELAIGRRVIDAASAEQVERFVYHSVLHPQTRAMPHHWRKIEVEEELLRSGLSFTVLRPAAYLQNLLPYWHQAKERGELVVPYAPTARLAMVDLGDVATIAAKMLTGPLHAGATYDLCGVPPVDSRGIGEAMSRLLDRPIEVRAQSVESWRRGAVEGGLDARRIEDLCAMFRFYDRFGLPGHPGILRWLLGRTPVDLETFQKRLVGSDPA